MSRIFRAVANLVSAIALSVFAVPSLAESNHAAIFVEVDHVRVAAAAARAGALPGIAEPLGWTVEAVDAPPADPARYGIDVGAPDGRSAWFLLRREDCCDLLAFHQPQHAWEAQDGDPYFRIEFLDAGGRVISGDGDR